MKYTHQLADHNKVTQQDFCVETAHRKSKGVLVLRTISHHNQKSRVVYHFDTGSLAGIGIDIPHSGTGRLVFQLVF
jgi:hypothetical protein